MIVLMLALFMGHANARSEATLSLIDFIGDYHGVARPASAADTKLGDVFSLSLDPTGITIPVEMKYPGSNEIKRTWLAHYKLDQLVYSADSARIAEFTAPNRICVGLRTTMWTEVTDIVCFQKNNGDRDSVLFVPIKDSEHIGRAELMRDRKPNARAADTRPEGIRQALISNGIYVNPKATPAQLERGTKLRAIRFAELSDVEKAKTLEEISKGFELASANEKMAVMSIVHLGLQDASGGIRLKALQQVALYVQTGSFVRPVLDVLTDHENHPNMIQMAVHAAGSLLEQMVTQLEAQAQLRRFHVESDPAKMFKRSNGLIDAVDLGALRVIESPRVFQTTYDRDHRVILIDALIALGENETLPIALRRSALNTALEHLPSNRYLQDYLYVKANFSISTEAIQEEATKLLRMFDVNPELFQTSALAATKNPKFERYFRERLATLLNQHQSSQKTVKHTHCEWMLEQLAGAN